MYVYLCVCATDKRTGYWHKHQYLGCRWISFCVFHFSELVDPLYNWWQKQCKLQTRTASLNKLHFWGGLVLKRIMISKNTMLDWCFLSCFWSVESVQTAHCWIPVISLALLAGPSFTPSQIWLDNFQLYEWSYNLFWQFCVPAALPVWLLYCVLSGEIKQTLELWVTERGCQIDQTQVCV